MIGSRQDFAKKRKKLIIYCFLMLAVLFLEAFYMKDFGALGRRTWMPEPDYSSVRMEESSMVQQFVGEVNRIEGFTIRTDIELIKDPQSVIVSLSKNHETVQSWSFSKYDVNNNQITFYLEQPLVDCKDQLFEIWIEAGADTGLLINCSNSLASGAFVLYAAGEEYRDKSLCYSLIEHSFSSILLFLMIAGFTVLVFVLLYWLLHTRKMKKEEHVFAFCYLCISLTLIFGIPLLKTPDEVSHFLRSYELSCGHLVSEKNPDDDAVGIQATGRVLPECFYDMANGKIKVGEASIYSTLDAFSYQIDEGEEKFVGFGNASLYAPVTYLPQAIGIAVTRIFSKSMMALGYGARFFNWLAVGLIFYFSIKYLPVGKKLALLIALLPMNMQACNSMSPDGFTLALCMAMVSFVLYRRLVYGHAKTTEKMTEKMTEKVTEKVTEKMIKKMRVRDYALMYLLIFALCQCKVVYIPVVLLLFLIPKEQFGTKKNYLIHILCSIILGIVIFGGWMLIASDFMSEFQPGVESGAQVIYVLRHPLDYLMTIVKTFDKEADAWLWGVLGLRMGWQTISTSLVALMVYGGLIIAVWLFDNDIACVNELEKKNVKETFDNGTQKMNVKEAFDNACRWWLGGVSALIVLLVCTSLYVQWTALRNDVISGIQGRYFIPVLFAGLMSLKPQKELINNTGLKGHYIYPMMLGVNLVVATILILNAL